MPQMLTDLEVQEVSLVDDPANPAANVLFYKKKANMTEKKKDQSSVVKSFVEGLVRKLDLWSLGDKPQSFNAMLDTGEKQEYISVLSRSLINIANSEATPEEKQQAMSQSVNEFLAYTQDESNSQSEDKMADNNTQKTEMTIEEKAAAYDALMAEQNKPKDDGANKVDAQKEESSKMEEMVKAAVEKATAGLRADLEKSNKKLEEVHIEKSKNQRIEKARELVGKAALDVSKVADAMEGMNETQQKAFEEVIKAAAAQAAAGNVFKRFGIDGASPTSAQQEVEKLAADIRKANPNLTPAQARSQVWKSRPDLVKANKQQSN